MSANYGSPPCSLQEASNRNFLSLTGFKFILNKAPKVDFLCNAATVPGIQLGSAVQTTYLKDIPIPGDKPVYDDLQIKFIVDENMENYLQIYKWITGLGNPESLDQFTQLKTSDRFFPSASANDPYNERSDGTLQVLNSNFQPSVIFKFKDLYPTNLAPIPFDATLETTQYFTALCNFKYTIFDIIDVNGKKV